MTSPTYTYRSHAKPCQGFDLAAGAKLRNYFRGTITRTDQDGRETDVWTGDGYADARRAVLQSNRYVNAYRRHFAKHGACFYDQEAARKAHAAAYAKVRKDTARELMDIASAGSRAAFDDQPEDACPFSGDSAQGITWTQAYRLTKDRLSDWAAEHPEPTR